VTPTSSNREDALAYALRLVEPPGVTHSSIETVSDEGAPPSAVIRQSRTASAIGILVNVMRKTADDTDDLIGEIRNVKLAMIAVLLMSSASMAGIILIYIVLAVYISWRMT